MMDAHSSVPENLLLESDGTLKYPPMIPSYLFLVKIYDRLNDEDHKITTNIKCQIGV
jgi:hypothetical protein